MKLETITNKLRGNDYEETMLAFDQLLEYADDVSDAAITAFNKNSLHRLFVVEKIYQLVNVLIERVKELAINQPDNEKRFYAACLLSRMGFREYDEILLGYTENDNTNKSFVSIQVLHILRHPRLGEIIIRKLSLLEFSQGNRDIIQYYIDILRELNIHFSPELQAKIEAYNTQVSHKWEKLGGVA